jgi:hypothetical protein
MAEPLQPCTRTPWTALTRQTSLSTPHAVLNHPVDCTCSDAALPFTRFMSLIFSHPSGTAGLTLFTYGSATARRSAECSKHGHVPTIQMHDRAPPHTLAARSAFAHGVAGNPECEHAANDACLMPLRRGRHGRGTRLPEGLC